MSRKLGAPHTFADINRGQLLYVHDKGKWLRWQDERWKWCEKGEEIEWAKELAIFITTEAAKVAAADPDRGSKLVRETAETHKEPRIMATLKLARSEPGMSATTAELDANPMLLGVANGVVDLRTGQLLSNRPDMLITRYCTSGFVPGAPAARWCQFLDEVFDGDTETIDAVQRLAGLTLTGVTDEERMICAVGSGDNGKSIFSNITTGLLGGYVVAAPSTLLAARRTAAKPGPRDRASSAARLPCGASGCVAPTGAPQPARERRKAETAAHRPGRCMAGRGVRRGARGRRSCVSCANSRP